MVVPTGGWFVVKSPQYVEEATPGTTPANPTFNRIGEHLLINPTQDLDGQDIIIVANEDPTAALKGKEKDILNLQMNISNSTFLKYGVQAQGGGTGTIDKTLAMLWSEKISGTENFWVANYCRINSLKLKGSAGKPLEVDCEIHAQKIPVPTTSFTIGTGAYASETTNIPWNYNDGGVSPVTINSVGLDITEIEVDVERNLEDIYVMGSTQFQYNPPKNRKVTGTFTCVLENTTNLTQLLNAAGAALTEYTLAWVLKSATSTLTISNVSLRKLASLEMKPDAVTYEKYAFEGRGVSVT